ncbi:MAG: T9SS type A sorting domain-containing protein, partial [Candidatus Marinimicrobia bacterium]|nr:T9SS type A sorting domain-containing protein [Candidatus Neomarinimicrobiota bacterium]
NYDESATHDDGSCWEANAGCECSDGMGAEVDECGVCNGDGIPPEECDCDGNVLDCAGVCGGDAEYDACGVCDGDGTSCDPVGLSFSNVTSGSLDVVMDNPFPVAGFQMDLPGINITSISGGTSEEHGFSISFQGSTLVGFSLTGDYIPAGNAVLFNVGFDAEGTEVCFANAIVSDENGEGADLDLGDCASLETGGGDCEEEWDGTACGLPGNSIHLSSGGSVLYNTNEAIAGFQLTVDGATILNASGGASEAAGFMISFSGSTVLGFSLDGSTIDGCDSAIELELDGSANGFSEMILSNSAGEPIDITYFEGSGNEGPCCGDGECNGNEDADSCPEDCEEEDCEEAWDGQACSMPGNSLNLSDGGSVFYNTNEAIAGFQLTVDGATILNASGGTSEAAGFMISFSGSTVLGFSLDGSTIDGCGSAIELELDGAANGFSDFIMSNAAGEPIDFAYFDGDANAEPCCGDGICNGDEDSESCPEDCGDDCPEGYDECGVCGGDNSTCADCNGVPNGDAEYDECGVCDGPGPEYECWDGEIVCNASECSAEPGSDPFSYNQSTSQAFYFVMTAYGNDGEYLEQGADWIGLFNGDVCVGAYPYAGGPTAVPAMGDDGYAYSAGYLQPGDEPTFRVYDASEDKYYDGLPSENHGFANNGMFVVNRLDAVFFQTLELNEAANLVSFFVLPNDASLDMLDPILDSISGVSTESMAAMYMDGFGWVGTLNGFELDRGYWLQMTAAASLSVEGDDIDFGIVYDLHTGANLISYSSDESSEISGAIPDDVEGSFISILGEGSAAMNTEDGWIGSLTHFDGGSGYWVTVSEDLSFSYDLDTGMGRIVEVYSEILPDNGEFNVVQSSEQAFYFVEHVELLEGSIEEGDWLLTYNKGTLTGIRQWQGVMIDVPAMGMTEDINTADYFVSGETPEFKLLKQSTSEMISLDGNIEPWNSNGVYVVNGLYEKEAAPEAISVDSAYPNPFNPSTNLSFGLPADADVTIQVYNLQGRVVATLAEGYMNAGYHSVTWNADNFSSGVYFVKVTAGSFSNTQKLLLVK